MPGKSPDIASMQKSSRGVVRVSSIPDALAESARMEKAFKEAKSSQKKNQIKRLAIFASNMASSMSKQKNVSAATRERYVKISSIYRELFAKLKGIETSCK